MFYAAGHFDCGIQNYKGYKIRFIPVGYWDFRIGTIYLAPNMYVQENELDKIKSYLSKDGLKSFKAEHPQGRRLASFRY